MPDSVPAHAVAGLKAMNAGKPLAELGDVQPVLDRYEAGETIEQIADTLGISNIAVYRWLTRKAEDQWKEYQAAKALAEYQAAEDELRLADDGVKVGRATQLLKSQQWKLERVLRRIYGEDHAQVAAGITINIGINRQNAAVLQPDLSQDGAELPRK